MLPNTYVEKLYVERANGRWESWVYGDSQRIYVKYARDYADIEAYAKRHHYKLVHVKG